MADLNVIRFDRNGDPETGLQRWDDIPAQALHSGAPIQTGHTYLDTANGVFTAGVWDCTPHELLPGPYAADELMIVLEGSIIIEHESGQADRFHDGDSFIIPKGTPCIWRQDEYARKFWAIHNNPDAPLKANPALNAIRAKDILQLYALRIFIASVPPRN